MDRTDKEVHTGISKIQDAAEKFQANIDRVIVGKHETIELLLIALLCEGHVLIEDVPGIGKTMLAKAAARSLNCSFSRIQCTPDLLPSDVTGIHYFNQKTGEFELRHGPIMAHIVLADEINRATPRTQSCLLESMQERQVTVDLETVPLPRPFLIIATQNPVELEGTFPLPEAQLDRFLLKVRLGYPAEKEEETILMRYQQENPLDSLSAVLDADEMVELQNICRKVHIEETVRNYVVLLAAATRNHRSIELGASPRASLGLYLASQALAAIRGRDYVIPDDVKHLAVSALSHRLICKPEVRLKGRSPDALIEEILNTVPVPVEE